ncbi:hypothetical protein PDESU_00281 [Pontiella desulfatans]|uniref:Peptidase S8/S53 domain-containing protein n=1 Tax=Pontiella desulfatans TaxID=2750659 RepID=A0A6C2TVP7_PONDE|nr:S8 family serine peptidase [Pontiella desulfatans]VGO11735.1 hypothetical protein PDESU_00281 [Pontiella desulfatans]
MMEKRAAVACAESRKSVDRRWPIRMVGLVGLSIFVLAAETHGRTNAYTRAMAERDAKAMKDARRKRSDIFSKRHDMNDRQTRADVVRQLKAAEEEHLRAVRRRAAAEGLELEGTRPDGRGFRLIGFDDRGFPVYEEDFNVDAAKTTAADEVRSNSAYNSVDGASVTIGLWESGGIPRVTHQELSGKVTVMDGSTSTSDHATHVAGTLVSRGINAATLGMAPGANVAAFSSSYDEVEMLANGAAEPGTTDIYLSNHSYGSTPGWKWVGSDDYDWIYNGTFSDDGDPSNDYDEDFGRYDDNAEEWDGIAYNLPYYLIFAAAGNSRTEAPATGALWKYGWDGPYAYDPANHPPGNRYYTSGGYDTMEGKSLSKNVITVGSSDEGISGGVRDPGAATAVTYSSRGPTDDGRIKPDIHGNGTGLTSCIDNSDTATASYSGTSMASPNVCGSAALLIDYFTSRFPGDAMRASTLKALILHTADDRGKTGPDYKYGWGVMNTQAAADVIKAHADNQGGGILLESTVDTAIPSRTRTFGWDGTAPLRVTLCWTDPAGTEKEGHDNRAKALVNDLNLKVISPDGTHYPYVMPYVGDWSESKFETSATTGVNDVDNVEQVYLSAPVAGDYLVVVDYAGALTDGEQTYSLVVTGQTAPEIEVEENGPPVVLLADNSGVQDFGATAPSEASVVKSYTVRNTGGSPLTGLAIAKSGSHADDFSVGALSSVELETGQTASFSVSYDPLGTGARSAALQLASNDANENPFDINLSATGYTELQAWRTEYFGTLLPVGPLADDADFDEDGYANLLEFGLATSPKVANPDPLLFAVDPAQARLTYPRNVNALADYTFEVIWTDNLSSNTWSSAGVGETVLSDDGAVQQVESTLPMGSSTERYFRLRISPK